MESGKEKLDFGADLNVRLPAYVAFELRYVLPLLSEGLKPADDDGSTVTMIDQAIDALGEAMPPSMRAAIDDRRIAEYRMDAVKAQQEAGVRSVGYIPLDSPRVLSPEEARLLVKANETNAPDNAEELFAFTQLLDRLAHWAEEEATDDE